jgi:ADP-ribose pyrophosphatase YjhB (NUDIX family)
MEIGESSAAGAARETLEEANAPVHILGPYAHWDIPVIGQVRDHTYCDTLAAVILRASQQ